MIEEVDPADTAKLDEIDARAWCWINKEWYSLPVVRNWVRNNSMSNSDFITSRYAASIIPKYTRSGDVLKANRPSQNKWGFLLANHCGKSTCNMWTHERIAPDFIDPIKNIESRDLPTEELAELHAIIQAIAYDRGES